ncbi:MAG: T9SS type A sorting domain-containing protein [Flavobacteriales bacterium]
MRTTLTIAFLAAHVFGIAQHKLTWGDTLSVVNDISKGNLRPKIAITGDQSPIVMWSRSFGEVYTSRLVDGSFTEPLRVTPEGMKTYAQFWVGPDMVAHGDTVYVTFISYPEHTGHVYVVRSVDGGASFGDTVRVTNDEWARFPALGVRPDGNPIVTYMQFDSGYHEPRYVVCNSIDWGETFSTPVDAHEIAGGEACDCCPGFVTGTTNRTFSLFRNNDNNLRDLWITESTSLGGPFNIGNDVDDNNWMINSCPSTGPDAMIVGDSVYAVWMSGASGFSRINLVSRDITTLGSGFNMELTPGSTANQNYPKIAGDGAMVGIAWQESDAWDLNIRFAWSASGLSGVSQSKFDTANLETDGAQTNPDIAFTENTFHIVWQDDDDKSVRYRSVEVSEVTGWNEPANNLISELYPNPSIEVIHLRLNQQVDKANLQLYDNQGTLVLERNSQSQEIAIDVSGLSTGIYFLRVQNGDLVEHHKCIVTN